MKNYFHLNIEKIINFLLLLLIILIFFALLTGYQCKYIEPSFCNFSLIKNLLKENGLIESLQFILLLMSILILFSTIKKVKKKNFVNIFIILKLLALTYYLGEEISWGQHFFKWSSPEIFIELNNQKETNLHNISNLFDQLPRSLVILWCSLIPIIFFYLTRNYAFKNEMHLIFLPHIKLLIASIILLILFLPDFFVDKLNLHPGHYIGGKGIEASKFYDFISFNYLERLSEIHELIFCFYFFIYALSFSNKLKNK